MADKRPGGLTALAVFNFIFGGLGLLGSIALLALLGVAEQVASEGGTSLSAAAADTGGPSMGAIYAVVILSFLSATLLIASGVGYLGQKLFLGRKLGNVYACLSLLSTVIGLAAIDSGFGIGTIIGLVYPCLTLALLNMNFKDDLVN